MPKRNNPISIQSKKWLTEALLDLMREKRYKEITIKEISKRADLDRRTFYRNFTSKDDVLNYYINKVLGEEYVKSLTYETKLTTYTVAKVYFEFCLKHIEFLTNLKDNDLLIFLLNKYDEYLPAIHDLFENEFEELDQECTRYALTFNTGGFWNIMVRWISDGADKTPEQMANIVNYLICGRFET